MSIPDRLLPKRAIIYTKTAGTKNTFREASFSWTIVDTDVKVSLQPDKEELSLTLHGNTYVCRDRVYLNYRTDFVAGDYIEISSVKYLIVSVNNEAGKDEHLKLYVTK